eukprot:TRINITY_DN5185_c0_g2_i2.p1 TRINITY_DN5185_c0_g2~~TRINITY_DN5185_c0_g2_i2.p1  ORF type:complete len:572 (-),score=103.68 TRINITY_DN5185_c0_g2_i2:372-1922(-)
MGLDILPDQVSSPPKHKRTSSSHLRPLLIRDNIEMGTRSLPDTPRISAARGSDVDPRLSLQLNKENIEMPEFSYFSRSVSRRDFISTSSKKKKLVVREERFREESRSPRAREIVKQVKESVKRRVGMDITNVSCRNRSCDESGKKTKRMSRLSEESKRSGQQSTSSWSPRLRYLEKKIKRIENKEPISVFISESPKQSSSKSYQSSSSSLSSTSTTLESLLLKESEEAKAKALPKSTTKCKKANCERFTQRAKTTNSTQTARKKCKTPFSKALRLQFHPSSNSTETPLQTVVTSPLHSAALSPHHHHQYDQNQKQPPQEPNPPLVLDRDNSSIPTTLSDSDAELLYVTAILDRTIVSKDHPTVPFTSWFSPSHPLDPSLFNHLEHSFQSSSSDGPLNQKSNRRLLFDFVDEILCTTLKLHLVMKPWLQWEKPRAFEREELVEQVGSKVGGFGSAKCETQQDIDGLVELEPWEANVRGGGRGRWCCYSAVDEEREAIVFEMERRILESLMEEALIFL